MTVAEKIEAAEKFLADTLVDLADARADNDAENVAFFKAQAAETETKLAELRASKPAPVFKRYAAGHYRGYIAGVHVATARRVNADHWIWGTDTQNGTACTLRDAKARSAAAL